MKYFLFVTFLLITGQSLAQSGNGVNLYEDPRISFYMNKYDGAYRAPAAPTEIYRIRLVATYNRNEANSVQGRFRNLYPNESSFLQHNGNQFLVTAGSFGSKTEAEIMLNEIKKDFPASFIPPPVKQ